MCVYVYIYLKFSLSNDQSASQVFTADREAHRGGRLGSGRQGPGARLLSQLLLIPDPSAHITTVSVSEDKCAS